MRCRPFGTNGEQTSLDGLATASYNHISMNLRRPTSLHWSGPRSRGTILPRALRPPLSPPRVRLNQSQTTAVRSRLKAVEPPPVAPAERPGVRSEKMQALEAVLLLAHEPLPTRKLSQYANLAD